MQEESLPTEVSGKWNELQFPPPVDLPTQGSNLCLILQADSLLESHQETPPRPPEIMSELAYDPAVLPMGIYMKKINVLI